MTVRDDVAALVRHVFPCAICDDCITEELGLTVRQHANHKTRELARLAGFQRAQGRCCRCKREKLVIGCRA
jgi:hypothetical protein